MPILRRIRVLRPSTAAMVRCMRRDTRGSSVRVPGPMATWQVPTEVSEPRVLHVVPVDRFPQCGADLELQQEEDAPVARSVVEPARQARLEISWARELVWRAVWLPAAQLAALVEE